MNITKKQYEAIAQALALLPVGTDFTRLSKSEQHTILCADEVMVELLQKRQADNERTAKYIAEKRKTNKRYAR